MKVKDVMTKNVTTVAPETSLKDVAAILVKRGISGLPVVGEMGIVVGVVSEGDILFKERGEMEPKRRGGVLGRLLEPNGSMDETKLAARTAGEAMTAPALTVGPSLPVAKAAALMIERGVNRLPVVDGEELVGIVTRADLVREFTRTDAEIVHEIREDVIARQLWAAPETITVEVEHGAVRLGGAVETKAIGELLPRMVERVPGVVSVSSTVRCREDD